MPDPSKVRYTKDAALIALKPLPAANGTNYSDSINLGTPTPGHLLNDYDALIELPATPSLVDAKTVTITLQDSADNVTFAVIAELAALVITGAGGVGAAAAERRVKLPPSTRQYLRAMQSVQAAGGDNTAISASLSLVF